MATPFSRTPVRPAGTVEAAAARLGEHDAPLAPDPGFPGAGPAAEPQPHPTDSGATQADAWRTSPSDAEAALSGPAARIADQAREAIVASPWRALAVGAALGFAIVRLMR